MTFWIICLAVVVVVLLLWCSLVANEAIKHLQYRMGNSAQRITELENHLMRLQDDYYASCLPAIKKAEGRVDALEKELAKATKKTKSSK